MTQEVRYTLSSEDHPSGRRVLLDGSNETVTTVDGVELEAQFQTSEGLTLLFLTEASPFEEGLHIYLLDADNKVLDAIEGGAPYTSGILQVRQVKDDAAAFTFFNNETTYCLTIHSRPSIRFRLPGGFRYKSMLGKRYLSLAQTTATTANH